MSYLPPFNTLLAEVFRNTTDGRTDGRTDRHTDRKAFAFTYIDYLAPYFNMGNIPEKNCN